MNQGNAIEVKNVSKSFKVYMDKGNTIKEKVLFKKRRRYENRHVLRGISFEVKKGEAIGLIGHNGCGKSTTLKLLTKIMYPDQGTISMCGRVSSLLELGAGFHPDMSGRENIYINASIFGLTRKEIEKRMSDIIAFSELEPFIDNPVRTYSSGMYMRLAFSVAINVDADILLIDEILAVGDANFQAKCFNKLRDIKADGTTIVIVSHSLAQIEQICERSIWINDGIIVKDGSPYDVHPEYLFYMDSERRRSHEQKDLEYDSEQKESVEKEKETMAEPGGVDAAEQKMDRWGQRDAYFKAIKMHDISKKEKSIFSTGDKIIFSIEIVVDRPVEEAVVGIGIVRNDGVYCYGTNTQIDGIREFSLRENRKVCLEIENAELLPGQYYIDFEIKDTSGIVMDYYRKARKIEIVSVINDVGIFRAKHKWTL